MECANCRREDNPAYTLRAHVERNETNGEEEHSERAVDLQFCSFECLTTWT